MNISKLILLQKDLDAVVNKNHPIKKGEDRVANKFNALVVELAEFANEGRWFKFWSDNSEARRYKEDYNLETDRFRSFDPLLEEYVDSLHFFLSIAIDEDWEKSLYVPDHWLVELEESGYGGGLPEAFNGVIYNLMKSRYTSAASDFHMAYCLFIAIGSMGFEFTDEVIEEAYIKKNKENHARQQNGY